MFILHSVLFIFYLISDTTDMIRCPQNIYKRKVQLCFMKQFILVGMFIFSINVYWLLAYVLFIFFFKLVKLDSEYVTVCLFCIMFCLLFILYVIQHKCLLIKQNLFQFILMYIFIILNCFFYHYTFIFFILYADWSILMNVCWEKKVTFVGG